MEQFPHLKFIQKLTGKPRLQGGGGDNEITLQNKTNRQSHSDTLKRSTSKIKSEWEATIATRRTQGLAEIDVSTTPVFLQINPDIIIAEFDLESFGIEIISEEDNGFIIGASFDNLRSLEEKINGFVTEEHGSGKIAEFWQIIEGNNEVWKPEHVLSEYLLSQWPKIDDNKNYPLEVSIAFAKPIGKEPDITKRGGPKRLEAYEEKLLKREELSMERQTHFEAFIAHYGEKTSSFVELEDSFACEVLISGKGLKDLVVNYQFVFEVSEIETVSGIDGVNGNYHEADIEILPPEHNAVEVGVIDSGIMEDHKYISSAIKGNSKSYLDNSSSTADYVQGGGHGTKVAGAILYPSGISTLESPYKLPCFIRNLRILNEYNLLANKYPASLMKDIIVGNEECKIFNLSVSSDSPFRSKHMSPWAAIIDKLSYEKNILFIIATGNIKFDLIQGYISNGKNYPEYLEERNCKLANPSQSCFSLSVGSINHNSFEDENWSSLGGENDISAFSRIGTGIWNTIKPDVVEYGGGLVYSKNGAFLIKNNEETSIELLRSTFHGGSAFGKESVGTSFSTPKVTNIAAVLKQLYPDENINLIRAFIAQGARLPNNYFQNPNKKSIQYFGFGIPSLERVTKNTDYRITFYNAGTIKAEEGHLYALNIPEELRSPGDEYDILLEVTLAFSAQIRRTRQKTKSYFSTWLDWTTSKIGESYNDFKDYALKEINDSETNYDKEQRDRLNNFDWKIKNRSDHGSVQDISRNNGSLQKDWTILKSYDLPSEISLAVRGHKGWDKNMTEIPYAITVSIEILGSNIPIYESIRVENSIEIEV
ncbi:MAG: S8 family peptidase [Bacteroidales bacterium]|nr:S8 family peptidase [Bacteroidales bacterium]